YHQHSRLPPVSDSAGGHGRILIQPADRADLLSGGGVDRGGDLHPLRRLLLVEARTPAIYGGTAQERVPGVLLQGRGMGHQSPLASVARLARPAGRWLCDWQPAQNGLFSKRPFLTFISRRVVG